MLNRIQRKYLVNPEKRRSTARVIRFPLVRRIIRASEPCAHRWIFLAPGYQMCAKCRAVRKKPSAMEHPTP